MYNTLVTHLYHKQGEYLAKSGVSTFAVSETQKYGHVTYFWNGNKSGLFDDKLETYEVPLHHSISRNTTMISL